MLTPKNHCVISAFMMEGLHGNRYDAVLAAWDQGCFELVSAMVEYAPYAERLVAAAMEVNDNDFPGIFDYEVSAPFGKWFGDVVLLTKSEPSVEGCHCFLLNETIKFFTRGAHETVDARNKMQAVLEAVPTCEPCAECQSA